MARTRTQFPRLPIGASVSVKSSGRGARRVYPGVIVAIVPAETHPRRYVPRGYKVADGDRIRGCPRPDESYLVEYEGEPYRCHWPQNWNVERAGE